MPTPKPLTQCDPPALNWSRPGIPVATNFKDTYYSTDGGLGETETIFLKGCGLPEGWQGRQRFVIGELGFGSGLNFLAAWRMWEATKNPGARLHFVSIEKFPFDAEQLKQALSAWPELNKYSEPLISQWPGRVKGFHRLHFGDVTLTLIHDDIVYALEELDAEIEAWFLDGFSPSKNPDMWSPDIMKQIATLSAPGARLGTFTVAGTVRRALTDVGFTVERREGFGRKRHRLEACFSGKFKTEKVIPTPTIIGAGIAGASLAQAFRRRGITPKIIHDSKHKAASHNAAALIKPRLDLQDRPESRFFLSSYLYALNNYNDYVLSEGIIYLPKSDIEMARFNKLQLNAPLPPQHINFDVKNKKLILGKSIAISPKNILEKWLEGINLQDQKLSKIPPIKSHTIFAAGYGIQSLLPSNDILLRYSRGQLTWALFDPNITTPITYGGYALPCNEELLIGATHQRLSTKEPFKIMENDDLENLKKFEKFTTRKAIKSSTPSRASVRVTTSDTLPLIEELENNLWLFTGLGSRGFVFAPLLAEAIVSKICGDPMPVSKKLWARFSAREKSNRKARPS